MNDEKLTWSSTRTLTLAILFVMSLCIGSDVAQADVPTSADIAACNRVAREGLQTDSATPIARDEAGASAARRASASAAGRPDVPGAAAPGPVTQSADAQIHGMDAHGAQDAAYRASYRVCMRKSGF